MQVNDHEAKRPIIVAVCGGIAAYKACELVRTLRKRGHIVVVAMTESAQKFVTPLTFAALSGQPVLSNVWDMSADGTIRHVLLAHEAKAVVVAPATATTIARLHAGMADDAVCALVLTTRAPVLLAPAMETQMWENPVTQRNVAAFTCIGPEAGALASGLSGQGRMSEPEAIADAVEALLRPQDLRGQRVVISAGPTREALDPVRFISNRSSGKMGLALAKAARARGATVALVHGPVSVPVPPDSIAVNSAQDMRDALQARLPADILIMAAAVADYAPATIATHKMKKGELGPTPSIALVQTPDVVASLVKGNTFCVGFAAETHDIDENARKKLVAKGLQLIVANDISQPGVGMDADDNHVRIFDAAGLVKDSGKASKDAVAHMILDTIVAARRS